MYKANSNIYKGRKSNAITLGTLVPHFDHWIAHTDRKSDESIRLKLYVSSDRPNTIG